MDEWVLDSGRYKESFTKAGKVSSSSNPIKSLQTVHASSPQPAASNGVVHDRLLELQCSLSSQTLLSFTTLL